MTSYPKISWLICLAVLLAISSPVNAEVYKWIDKNGKVHYSDKPFDQNAEKIQVDDSVSKQQQLQAQQEANRMIKLQNRRLNNQFEDERETALQQQESVAQEKKLTQACQQANEGLLTLQMQAPVYIPTKNGERKYLSDEQRKKEIEELKGKIAKHCKN